MAEILIMRHGDAERTHPMGDRARSLTPVGEQDARAIGAGLTRQGLVPDLVLHSPYTRAVETADLVAGPVRPRLESGLLVPTADAALARDFILQTALDHQARRVLVVSHLPMVRELCSWLVHDSPEVFFDFRPGSLLHIQMADLYPLTGVRGFRGAVIAFLGPQHWTGSSSPS